MKVFRKKRRRTPEIVNQFTVHATKKGEILHIDGIGFVGGEGVDGRMRYQVTTYDNGSVMCSCPAWKFQSKTPEDRVCKHILKLYENYGVDKSRE